LDSTKPPKKLKRPPGAGRKKGTPNKVTADIIQTLKDAGHEPAAEHIKLFKEALRVYKLKQKRRGNEWGGAGFLDLAVKANGDLMKYVYPTRKAVEHTGANGGPIEFKTYHDIVKALGGNIEDAKDVTGSADDEEENS
jgi:hypothetical protein